MKNKTTNTCPPVEIFDILHWAESKGLEIPKNVDEWWAEETLEKIGNVARCSNGQIEPCNCAMH